MSGRSVWLVRHASTPWTGARWSGRADVALSDAGRLEAERLAGVLVPRLQPQVRLLSSPSSRAHDTARAIAALPGLTVEVDPDLREVDLGQVEGLTFDEVKDAFPDLAAEILAGRTALDWPDGERAADLRRRVVSLWERIGTANGEEIVAVSHGGVIGELLRLALPPGSVPARYVRAASAIHLVESDGWQLVERLDGGEPADAAGGS